MNYTVNIFLDVLCGFKKFKIKRRPTAWKICLILLITVGAETSLSWQLLCFCSTRFYKGKVNNFHTTMTFFTIQTIQRGHIITFFLRLYLNPFHLISYNVKIRFVKIIMFAKVGYIMVMSNDEAWLITCKLNLSHFNTFTIRMATEDKKVRCQETATVSGLGQVVFEAVQSGITFLKCWRTPYPRVFTD